MRLEQDVTERFAEEKNMHGDLGVALFFQQLGKGPENGLPAFPLPAIHEILPEQFDLICSVSNESGFLIIVDSSVQIYNNHEHDVR